jgi:hypothetical protein
MVVRTMLHLVGQRQHNKIDSSWSHSNALNSAPELGELSRALWLEFSKFCISLLDHLWKGKIYTVWSSDFLLSWASTNSTHYLSAFTKIIQLLLMQHAVVAADSGEVKFPREILDDM